MRTMRKGGELTRAFFAQLDATESHLTANMQQLNLFGN